MRALSRCRFTSSAAPVGFRTLLTWCELFRLLLDYLNVVYESVLKLLFRETSRCHAAALAPCGRTTSCCVDPRGPYPVQLLRNVATAPLTLITCILALLYLLRICLSAVAWQQKLSLLFVGSTMRVLTPGHNKSNKAFWIQYLRHLFSIWHCYGMHWPSLSIGNMRVYLRFGNMGRKTSCLSLVACTCSCSRLNVSHANTLNTSPWNRRPTEVIYYNAAVFYKHPSHSGHRNSHQHPSPLLVITCLILSYVMAYPTVVGMN